MRSVASIGGDFPSFRCSIGSKSLLICIGILMLTVPGRAAVLTGLIEFGTNANGNVVAQEWNTVGGEGNYNLYVVQGAPSGPFINSGDGPSTSINVPLAPGTNTFSIFGDSVNDLPYYGLNLFFDGGAVNPSISAFAPISTRVSLPLPFLPIPAKRSSWEISRLAILRRSPAREL